MAQPLEYIIVGFTGNQFGGQIATELAKVIESGLVKIHDLIFIAVGEDDETVVMEVDETDGLQMFAELDGEVGGLIGPDDIAYAASAVEGGSSVLLIIWENLWAAGLAGAIEDAGGFMIEGARVPEELSARAIEALADAG